MTGPQTLRRRRPPTTRRRACAILMTPTASWSAVRSIEPHAGGADGLGPFRDLGCDHGAEALGRSTESLGCPGGCPSGFPLVQRSGFVVHSPAASRRCWRPCESATSLTVALRTLK